MGTAPCARCGHDIVFHAVGTGHGVAYGKQYCDDRYSQPCDCSGYVGGKRSIYIIGSMRNQRVPEVAKALRAIGWDAFDDWYSPGPEADDKWQEYERARGRTYREALDGYHARHVFDIDKHHLDRCSQAVLVAPAGKSGHLELGYMIGRGKPGYILLDGEPERYDIMTRFATQIFMSLDEMLEVLK